MRNDRFTVGHWTLDPAASRLERQGEQIHLEPRLTDLLCHFARNPRRVIPKEELINVVWQGRTLDDTAVARAVAELRKALGYEKIILNGTSFGSQWSFAVMRLHPGIVARALLSGIEPLNHGYDMPSHVFAAVQRMWRTLDEDPRFESYLPEGGMAEITSHDSAILARD